MVVPHVGRTMNSTVDAINAGLQSLKSGRSTLGKVAVIVDRNIEEPSSLPLLCVPFRSLGFPKHFPRMP